MHKAAGEPRPSDDRRKGRRSINWAAVSSLAAIGSALAAMVGTGYGILHPPIAFPAIRFTVIEPSSKPTQSAEVPTSTPSYFPSPAGIGLAERCSQPQPSSTAMILAPGVTITPVAISSGGNTNRDTIQFEVLNNSLQAYALRVDFRQVAIIDNCGNSYRVDTSALPTEDVSVNASGGDITLKVTTVPMIDPAARSVIVTFAAISGNQSIQMVVTQP